jgi:hypothetical protein
MLEMSDSAHRPPFSWNFSFLFPILPSFDPKGDCMLEYGVHLWSAARAFPLEEGLAPVIEAILLLGSLAIGIGVCIARSLTRTTAAKAGEDLLAPCRRHDWLPNDEGGYVCVRCSYRAGS